MASKEAKKRSREQRLADQPRWDAVTRRLQERIERGLRELDQRAEKRRESSISPAAATLSDSAWPGSGIVAL